jgi:pyruvate/2-oxoglutarate dehydrogenase complex dihydrolipoamide acyltransferase (E2) component
MAVDIKLPDLGDGIDSGDILEVLVSEGDVIQKDQGIVEIETEKATVEVPSPQAGRVTKVHVSKGQSVPVGSPLVSVEAEQQGAEKQGQKDQPAPAQEAQAEPEPEEAQEESPPEKPAAAAPKAEAPRRPASSPPPRPSARPAASPRAEAARPSEPAQPEAESGQPDTRVAPAGPAVRRLAREVGVNLIDVPGSGPGGRITRDDVMGVVRQGGPRSAEVGPPAEQTGGAHSQSAETSDAWGPVEIQRASKIRRTIASKMHESWSTVPRVTNFDDADVTEVERIRQASKADYAAAGIKLTSLPFVIKAVAMSLRHHPLLNASLDVHNEQIVYKKYINIGIAVDTPRGLVVPSLRNADHMPISDIARALGTIAENARTNSFTLDDLRGSTFSISNLGAIGGTYSTPIVNTPEVAILLVGRARKLPVVTENDQIVARLTMPLSLSYDHRLVDGAAAARFLNDVIGFLEAPSRLFMAP